MKNKNKNKSPAEARIIVAATKIFSTKGLAGATVRHIAKEANVNPAMIYYYYRSKGNLFSLVFKNALEKFLPPTDYLLHNDIDIYSKIEILCDNLIEIQIANPYLSIFILNEIEKDPEPFKKEIWHHQKEKIRMFANEIQRNINNKTIRKIEPLQLFMNILALCIFPFIAKLLFAQISGLTHANFIDFLMGRKAEVKNIIIQSMKKI